MRSLLVPPSSFIGALDLFPANGGLPWGGDLIRTGRSTQYLRVQTVVSAEKVRAMLFSVTLP
jgi:hypothetical protein